MIPPFDRNNVLPPYYNGPSFDINAQSPYTCDILEICQRFGINDARRTILKGFIQFRLECVALGITGFQWIDGSFVENIEAIESRNPRDIDVITFFCVKDATEESRILAAFPEFADAKLSKVKFSVDHYPVLFNTDPYRTMMSTKYWTMLFSHNRRGVWKGMLQLPIYDTDDKDKEALNYLISL